MSPLRGWDEEEKLDQMALTASRSSRGMASKDCGHHQDGFSRMRRRWTDLLQLQICSLVRHTLMPNTKLAVLCFDWCYVLPYWFFKLVMKRCSGRIVGGETSGGEGIADIGGGGGGHRGYDSGSRHGVL